MKDLTKKKRAKSAKEYNLQFARLCMEVEAKIESGQRVRIGGVAYILIGAEVKAQTRSQRGDPEDGVEAKYDLQ